jgi:2-oxoisovalerate dehydrogenase E1 component
MRTATDSNIVQVFQPPKTSATSMGLEPKTIENALLIRCVEQTFLELFAHGKLNGTVHTCVGQEFSALAFAGQLSRRDFIFSNHRCHGHYLAFTGDYYGLIAELMGKESGVCGGIGSSQHLCKHNFFSNGIQGGIVPVAAGMALANKLKANSQIGIVFIGDGTLGQGVVYETMNLVSRWEIPLLIVCENNLYAQSTAQKQNLAGSIRKRAEAFGIRTAKSDTWHPDQLFDQARQSIEKVRSSCKPIFHLVDTYRLNAHSKGDDERDPDEIDKYRQIDPLCLFQKKNPEEYDLMVDKIMNAIHQAVNDLDDSHELALKDYLETPTHKDSPLTFYPLEPSDIRLVKRINHFFTKRMADDDTIILLGEDIADPYGGAYKVTKGLSEKYSARVFSSPISEAALTGVANGLALAGMKPYLEIMFGDFMTLCMDQIINHASKFHHMYNKQVKCPVVIRTPMGGGRGYGPTHSQTLDKFLIGIDNVTTVALNRLVDPLSVYETVYGEAAHPVVVLENKNDYGKKIGCQRVPNYVYEVSAEGYPVVRIRPIRSDPTVTIVTYGAMADIIVQGIEQMIVDLDLKPEIIIPTCIHPISGMSLIMDSVRHTKKLCVAEEGSAVAGFGSEVIAAVSEALTVNFTAKRLSSLPVPIPSAKSLEKGVLLSLESILKSMEEVAR